jgi:DNA-binding GntR family transcriptional regulator
MVQQVERPPTLTATVVDSIRDGIFRGELKPATPLREVEMAEALAVSRGTVREALRTLQDESLVEIIPHRGAFVTSLTPKTAKEVYTFRALIEPYALRLCMEADTYTPEDLEYLEALAARLDELEKGGGDTYETVKSDIDFHDRVCSPCNHELLLNAFTGLQSLTWLFVLNFHLYQSTAYSDEPSHPEVVRAIRSGDVSRAEETLKKHIEAAGSALLTCMHDADSDLAPDV